MNHSLLCVEEMFITESVIVTSST